MQNISNISTQTHWESKHSSEYKCICRGFNSKTNTKNKVKCYSLSRIARDTLYACILLLRK